MSQFIIEMGSANEHHNDIGYLREMINAVVDCDSGKHEVVFKHQLFETAPPNEPLLWRTFSWARGYAWEMGYQTTASVFDVSSLNFLSKHNVPFVKIACRPRLYWMVRAVAPGRRVYVSVSNDNWSAFDFPSGVTKMRCVPEYPALRKKYDTNAVTYAVSDHTVGWDLYNDWKPDIIEKHFCLCRSDDNPDSGPFAVTPDELREVL